MSESFPPEVATVALGYPHRLSGINIMVLSFKKTVNTDGTDDGTDRTAPFSPIVFFP